MCIHVCIYGQIIPFRSLCGNSGWEMGLDAATVNVPFCLLVILPPLKGNRGPEGWWRGDWVGWSSPVEKNPERSNGSCNNNLKKWISYCQNDFLKLWNSVIPKTLIDTKTINARSPMSSVKFWIKNSSLQSLTFFKQSICTVISKWISCIKILVF